MRKSLSKELGSLYCDSMVVSGKRKSNLPM
jgi:hypothetical protein